jgi:hypothetical protein
MAFKLIGGAFASKHDWNPPILAYTINYINASYLKFNISITLPLTTQQQCKDDQQFWGKTKNHSHYVNCLQFIILEYSVNPTENGCTINKLII